MCGYLLHILLCLATHCDIAAMNCVVLFIFKTKSFHTVEKTLNCQRLPSKSTTVNFTVNVGVDFVTTGYGVWCEEH